MFFEDEILVMDEGTSIQQDVKFIKMISVHLCLIQDNDGDQWEVTIERLNSINNEIEL